MDPVMHTAHSFLAQADAFWRKHPGRLQALVGLASDRADMVRALRLGELCAGNRIVLRVGKSLVVIDEHGAIEMVGVGMNLKMAKALRVRSANVELL
jgi:hypothetical protein